MYEHAYSKNERYYYISSNELYHHGIKGQKWGVRRYQNADGSLTSAGRKRYGDGEVIPEGHGAKKGLSDSTKKKLKTAATIGVALAVTAGVSVYVAKHPELAKKASQYISDHKGEIVSTITKAGTTVGKTAAKGAKAVSQYLVDHKDTIIGAATKTGEALLKYGKKAGTVLGKSLEKAADAATGAAAATLGTFAAMKIAEKYAEQETDSEKVKLAKQVAINSATAAIDAATHYKSGITNTNNNKSSTGGQVGKEITDAIGAPSNKGIDRQSKEYQNLFKNPDGSQRDADTRSIIKSMASAGYDLDQINQYLELKHYDLGPDIYYAVASRGYGIRLKKRR